MSENLPTMQVLAVLVVRFARQNAVESSGHRCAEMPNAQSEGDWATAGPSCTTRSTSEIGILQQ
jgi:hypothetical protein